jgi:hypothetical protein
MKFHKLVFWATVFTVALAVQCFSQIPLVPAPGSLPPCLIQFDSDMAASTTSSLILYNADRTYFEIRSYHSTAVTGLGSGSGSGTNAPGQGTFTYTVDPQDPGHATIVHNGTGNLGSQELYFTSVKGGSQTRPFGITSGNSPRFTLYPSQISNGGCAFSNRCVLASGGIAISGLAVQSDGPRWVLIRAVGASLGNFGVSPCAASPSLTLYDGNQGAVGASSVWSADPNLVGGFQKVFSLVGAFSLTNGSDEGVLLVPLNPGAYTAVIKAGSAGTILCEAYILPF